VSDRAAVLLPNLGGEEPGDWRAKLREPAVAASARLWRLLFSRQARLVSGDAAAREPADDAWPEALGPPPSGPVYPWLEAEGAAVPWYRAAGLEALPELAGRRIVGPAAECVARVHDKAFAHDFAAEQGYVARPLRGLAEAFDPDELKDTERALDAIAQRIRSWPAWTAGRYTLKPRMGCSGRGRLGGAGADGVARTLRPGLRRMAERGGALLEPWLTRTRDFSTQLYIDAEARVLLLGSLEQILTPSGLYRGHRGEIDSRGRVFTGHVHEEALREAAAALAGSARSEDYRGPMGTVVLGLVRHALQATRRALDLQPGERRAFYFGLDAATGWQAITERLEPNIHFVPLWREGDALRPALLFGRDRAALDAALEGA